MANMIFHHPLPISPEGKSGSSVRPYQMIQAFKKIGYEVAEVTGYGAERKKAINRVKKEVKQGKQYDFIYSESSTMPTLLTEPHHYPTHPFLDFSFLRWAKKQSIPVGLFYRDIYWRFSMYANEVSWHKRAISIPLYKYDWMQYQHLLDHLFLPSDKMIEFLPSIWVNKGISALPPGCDLCSNVTEFLRLKSKDLKLFYVGGITPPGYDLRSLFQIINGVKGIHLTICCRKQEWNDVSHLYNFIKNEAIDIIHQSGSRLHNYYEEADIFAMLRSSHEYLDFAMPVKVFESMGNGLPILTLNGTEAARFIKQEDIGWVVDTIDEAGRLLRHLSEHREEIEEKRQKVLKARENHTWEARARTVAKTLTKMKGTP